MERSLGLDGRAHFPEQRLDLTHGIRVSNQSSRTCLGLPTLLHSQTKYSTYKPSRNALSRVGIACHHDFRSRANRKTKMSTKNRTSMPNTSPRR